MSSTEKTFSKCFPVSWDQLHRDAKALSWRLLEKGPFTGLAVVTRGGMVPAAVVARELDLHHIDTICISSYDWQNQKSATIIKDIKSDGEGWLIIDDLVDTGSTAKILREMMPKAHFACLYAKPEGRPLVDTFITEVSQDTWILFPWDSEVQYVMPLAAKGGKEGA